MNVHNKQQNKNNNVPKRIVRLIRSCKLKPLLNNSSMWSKFYYTLYKPIIQHLLINKDASILNINLNVADKFISQYMWYNNFKLLLLYYLKIQLMFTGRKLYRFFIRQNYLTAKENKRLYLKHILEKKNYHHKARIKKYHYNRSLKMSVLLKQVLKSYNTPHAPIKSKSPGSRHTSYLLKLRLRQILQKIFRYETTYKFYKFFQHKNLVNLQRYTNFTGYSLLPDFYFRRLKFNDRFNRDIYSVKDSITLGNNITVASFFLAQFLRLKILLIVMNYLPTIAAADFYLKYGLININHNITKNSSYLVRPGDIIRVPIMDAVWMRYQFKRSLTLRKRLFLRQTNQHSKSISSTSYPWLVLSRYLPIAIMWRLPFYNEINEFLYKNWFIIIPNFIHDYLQSNPYHIYKK